MGEDREERGLTTGDAANVASREPPPPAFPLTREQFADALARGLGRAHLHVRRHGAAGLDDLVLDACLQERAYDPQCEEDRAPWLANLIDAAGLQDAILPALVDSLRDVVGVPDEDCRLRCSLAAQMARRGQRMARDALYAVFRASVARDDFTAGGDILRLDGADGLLAVTDVLGQRLAENPALDVAEEPMTCFDSTAEAGQARAILEKAATGNAAIRRYLEHVDAAKSAEPAPRPKPSVEEIIREIEDTAFPRRPSLFRRWGRTAPDADLGIIVQRLRQEDDPERLRRCIWCFRDRAYPLVRPRLIKLAEHPDSQVRNAAIDAVGRYDHSDVRALALRRIRAGHIGDGEVSLLEQNFVEGDHELIEQALSTPTDRDVLHEIAKDAVCVFEVNTTPAARTSMLFVYEHTACSICRGDAVRLLIQQNQAPAWLIEEGQFDACGDTRELCHKVGRSDTQPAT